MQCNTDAHHDRNFTCPYLHFQDEKLINKNYVCNIEVIIETFEKWSKMELALASSILHGNLIFKIHKMIDSIVLVDGEIDTAFLIRNAS